MKLTTRWGIALLLTASLGLVLAFVLSLLAQGPTRYERHFVWLFWINVAAAALLVVVLAVTATRLALRMRSGKFGSRLLLKLAAIFALVGVVPGGVIYTVSYQFVSRSIEAWFDTRVDDALRAGLALGKGTLEALSEDLSTKTRLAAERLSEARRVPDGLGLERLREQLGVQEAALIGGAGQVLVAAGPGVAISPERPASTLLRQARQQPSISVIEGLEEDDPATAGRARIRAIAQVPSASLALVGDEERFLMVVQPLPEVLTRNALAVQAAYREYQARSLAREGLRRMYIGTLTLAMVLAVFGAVLLAVLLGNQIARPLLLLAEGMRQVAAGDLGAKPVFASRDELGGLTRNFAAMTEQLGSAREQAQRSLRQLENARTRLQTILDNLTAGVIVFDREGRIDTVNPGATRILRAPVSAGVGRPLAEVPGLAALAASVDQRFSQHHHNPEEGERDQWQDAFELSVGDAGATLTLLVRGAILPPGPARLIVFDDITEVVSAQRAAAWSEVARRLAHEIKNPLTPIQLSAERLQHKLEAKLDEPDQAMLARSVATIVAQVQAMKQLVNEFRDYARLPSANMQPLDLNALVAEVLALYGDEQDQGRLQAQCDRALPAIQGDATQLRQVVHNLVQNALDAVAGRDDGRVVVSTDQPPQETGRPAIVRLRVTDNGPGFADKVLKRAFEPYMTTKTKGTGLGLAVVKKIADEHGARVRIVNLGASGDDAAPAGAQVSLSFSGLTDVGATATAPDRPATRP
ncbi:sensor histidine kinase [Ideonella alba]|uniref:histidine kinase n=1 Tax=Ideonella alba TaxID=2824118 RepID=A0A940Y7Q8_9BURK|nr:ATP-binding protein [Ideonella alba]MBQ0929228.1 HAMP domain-containing protein [Ideonella alba]